MGEGEGEGRLMEDRERQRRMTCLFKWITFFLFTLHNVQKNSLLNKLVYRAECSSENSSTNDQIDSVCCGKNFATEACTGHKKNTESSSANSWLQILF